MKVVVHLRSGQTVRFKARKVMALRGPGGFAAIDFINPSRPVFINAAEVAAMEVK